MCTGGLFCGTLRLFVDLCAHRSPFFQCALRNPPFLFFSFLYGVSPAVPSLGIALLFTLVDKVTGHSHYLENTEGW